MDFNVDAIEYLRKISEDLDLMKKIILMQNRVAIVDTLGYLLDEDKKIKLYNMLDGETSLSELSSRIDVHRSTLSRWLSIWANRGIVDVNISYRRKIYVKVFDLEVFNISVSKSEPYYEDGELIIDFTQTELFELLHQTDLNYPNELKILSRNVFSYYYPSVPDLVQKYFSSSTKAKMLFMQGMKNISGLDQDSYFVQYFKRWENNIKNKTRW